MEQRIKEYLKFRENHKAHSIITETIEFILELIKMEEKEYQELKDWWNKTN